MSLSIQELVSDGTLSTVVLGIEYLQRNDIYVRIAGVETPQSGAPSGYTWSFIDNNTIRVLPVVPSGTTVAIYRRTDLDAMYNIYSQNAQFDESTIDENNQQLLFIAQEYFEQAVTAKGIASIEYVSEDETNVYYRFVLADGTYTNSFAIPKPTSSGDGVSAKEALRRSYADAGYTLVVGSFEEGGTLTSASDVLLHKATGVAYSGPIGSVAAGTDPTLPGSGYVPRADVVLRNELIAKGPLSVRSGKLSLRDVVSVKDFGAIGDGYTDDTAAIQSAINASSVVYFPAGVYKISSVTVSSGKKLYGDGNKHLYLRNAGGVTLSQVKTLGGTWIYGTSLTYPAINAACSSISSGLHIEGLCFYQDHANYASPTDYPFQISDEHSTAYWSGVTVKNCMFINSNRGISFMRAERSDLTDINGDFFRRGIRIFQSNDASRMNRIHIWNFAQSTAANAFRQSVDSGYAITIEDADEIFVSEISIWDRLNGISAKKLWGTLRSITLDTVGVPMVIDSPIGFATTIQDVKINAENPVAIQNAAIRITGTAADTASIYIDGVSCWKGGTYPYFVESTIEINCSGLVCEISNVNHKFANKNGVYIVNAKEVSLNTHKFQNYFHNQTSSTAVLTTVGIRNESTTCRLSISNIKAGVLKFLFDGYCDLVSFLDTSPSLILTNQVMQCTSGSISAAGLNTGNNSRYFRYSNTDNTKTFSGLRCIGGTKNNKSVSVHKYIIGAKYKNITAIDAPADSHKFIGFQSYSGEDNFLILDTAIHSATRCAIQVYIPGGTGNMTVSSFAQTFNGTMEIYEVWMCDTDHIAKGVNENNSYLASAPTSTACYHMLGDAYSNSSPAAAGYIGWVCTAAGNPGTWKTFGAISA